MRQWWFYTSEVQLLPLPDAALIIGQLARWLSKPQVLAPLRKEEPRNLCRSEEKA